MGLITHKDSPYIRGLGFMYIRSVLNIHVTVFKNLHNSYWHLKTSINLGVYFENILNKIYHYYFERGGGQKNIGSLSFFWGGDPWLLVRKLPCIDLFQISDEYHPYNEFCITVDHCWLALPDVVDIVRTPRICGTGTSRTWMMRRYERTACLPKPGNVTQTDFPTLNFDFIMPVYISKHKFLLKNKIIFTKVGNLFHI